MAGKPKTHCISGHEYTPENTVFWKKKARGNLKGGIYRVCRSGIYRVCRICKLESNKLYDVYKRKYPPAEKATA